MTPANMPTKTTPDDRPTCDGCQQYRPLVSLVEHSSLVLCGECRMAYRRGRLVVKGQ